MKHKTGAKTTMVKQKKYKYKINHNSFSRDVQDVIHKPQLTALPAYTNLINTKTI
ncbi:hypothetical protein Hanom_Chr03g00244141 [Helianthus anomalus]